MAEIVIGIAASHAPNLAKTSMLRGVDEEQLSRIGMALRALAGASAHVLDTDGNG
jgi:hypothetical protein